LGKEKFRRFKEQMGCRGTGAIGKNEHVAIFEYNYFETSTKITANAPLPQQAGFNS